MDTLPPLETGVLPNIQEKVRGNPCEATQVSVMFPPSYASGEPRSGLYNTAGTVW